MAQRWLAGLFVLWGFCNPFFAVDRRSIIYVSRALADLDPAGIGQDAMFRLDGQSAFTVFNPPADGAATPAGTEWTAPIRQLAVTEGRGREVWRVLSRYAVIPCAKSR